MSHPAKGFAVTVHYLDGTPAGPRIAESRASPLRVHAGRWQDLAALVSSGLPASPSVYLLTGSSSSGSTSLPVRPGEAGDVRRRLLEHGADITKCGFAEVFTVTAADARLTKADVRFMEARMHELVASAPGSQLHVDRIPAVFAVPPSERVTLETWIDQSRVLLHAAGCRAIDAYGLPLQSSPTEMQDSDDGSIEMGPGMPPSEVSDHELTYDGIWARGYPSLQGFVMRAGSDVRRRENAALLPRIADRRRWLQQKRLLGEIPGIVDRWRLMADVLLPSALIAAKVVTGAHVSNRGIWRRVAAGSSLVIAQ